MTGHPSYSVVMPLWNKEREVTRAVMSVLRQTVRNLELIVVNDGSADGSRTVVERIADPRIRVLNQENAGVSAARNAGIRCGTAPYVAFLDADDEWCPDFLERIGLLARRSADAAVFATGYLIDTGDGRRYRAPTSGVRSRWSGIVPDYFGTSGLLSCSSTVVRRDAFEVAGYFPDRVSFGEDLDTWFRLAARFRIAFDSHPCAVCHVAASNRATARVLRSSAETLFSSLRSIESASTISASTKLAARRYAANLALAEIKWLLARGRVHEARAALRYWRRHYAPTARYGILVVAARIPPLLLTRLSNAGVGWKALVRRHLA